MEFGTHPDRNFPTSKEHGLKKRTAKLLYMTMNGAPSENLNSLSSPNNMKCDNGGHDAGDEDPQAWR